MHSDITPPWGTEVAKALDDICKEDTNGTDEEKSSFDKTEEAVLMTVCAFHRQNDIEQGARLGRKNMQVMDRLAKMQAHKRNSIERIKNAYGRYVFLITHLLLVLFMILMCVFCYYVAI